MKPSPHIERKDIARLLGSNFTVQRIKDNEERWGLIRARVKVDGPVTYRTRDALQILARLGFDVPKTTGDHQEHPPTT